MSIGELAIYIEKTAHEALKPDYIRKSSSQAIITVEIYREYEGTFIGPKHFDVNYNTDYINQPYVFTFDFKKLEVMKKSKKTLNRMNVAYVLKSKIYDSSIDTKIKLVKRSVELKMKPK